MNKDNILFLLFGVLLGFVAAYLAFDALSTRQPPRRLAGNPNPAPPAAAQPQDRSPTDEIRQLQSRLEANPDDIEAIIRLANLNFDVQNWARAKELYLRYLELHPGTPDVLSDLGVCHRAMQEYEEALAAFDRAQEQDPDHWQSLYNEVVVLVFDLGRLQEGEAILQRLRQLQPDNPEVAELSQAVARRREAA